VILSDTVGFIRKLPKELETAFQATLEELYEASLLVHVVDASDKDAIGKYNAVRKILTQMELADAPELVVLNKIDAADAETVEALKYELSGVAVSAAKRNGIGDLLKVIDARLSIPQSAPQPVLTDIEL
jgi:GTP-binding protein HflX